MSDIGQRVVFIQTEVASFATCGAEFNSMLSELDERQHPPDAFGYVRAGVDGRTISLEIYSLPDPTSCGQEGRRWSEDVEGKYVGKVIFESREADFEGWDRLFANPDRSYALADYLLGVGIPTKSPESGEHPEPNCCVIFVPGEGTGEKLTALLSQVSSQRQARKRRLVPERVSSG